MIKVTTLILQLNFPLDLAQFTLKKQTDFYCENEIRVKRVHDVLVNVGLTSC